MPATHRFERPGTRPPAPSLVAFRPKDEESPAAISPAIFSLRGRGECDLNRNEDAGKEASRAASRKSRRPSVIKTPLVGTKLQFRRGEKCDAVRFRDYCCGVPLVLAF